MAGAHNKAREILLYPSDAKYEESIRQFQGCPTIAATPKGRLFLGWYSGGTKEPHIDNYNLLVKSDDGGKTWSRPVLVIPSSRDELVHALDIQLWMAPTGELHVYWVQNDVVKKGTDIPDAVGEQPLVAVDEFVFNDFTHSMWRSICRDPDADALEFGEPECVDTGFLRCKPTVLKSGRLLFFNYDQMTDTYGYSISDDGGKTHTRRYGAKKVRTRFDEAMAYQLSDGSIRMFARAKTYRLIESVSRDNGETWSDAEVTDILSPDTRFFVSRTPSGRIMLVHNDSEESRCNMTVKLSEDDGKTWKYSRTIDTRNKVSYPDADFHGGKIYLTYDRERTGAKEILFLSFTEEDIMNPDYTFDIRIVSKP